MKISAHDWVLHLYLLGVTLIFSAGSLAAKTVDDGIVITDVTLISPERKTSLPHGVVAIRGDRIAAIGSDLVAGPHAKQIDGRGRFLIPGLIDSHVHVGNMGPLDDDAISAHPELLDAYRTQLPKSYLAFGFTTLVDLDLREQTPAWFIRTCAVADEECESRAHTWHSDRRRMPRKQMPPILSMSHRSQRIGRTILIQMTIRRCARLLARAMQVQFV